MRGAKSIVAMNGQCLNVGEESAKVRSLLCNSADTLHNVHSVDVAVNTNESSECVDGEREALAAALSVALSESERLQEALVEQLSRAHAPELHRPVARKETGGFVEAQFGVTQEALRVIEILDVPQLSVVMKAEIAHDVALMKAQLSRHMERRSLEMREASEMRVAGLAQAGPDAIHSADGLVAEELSAPHSLKPIQNSFRPGCKQFGSTTLSQLYQNFSDEVTFILNPFVYSIDTALKCVDEAAPYPLEQQSMRVAKGHETARTLVLLCLCAAETSFASGQRT